MKCGRFERRLFIFTHVTDLAVALGDPTLVYSILGQSWCLRIPQRCHRVVNSPGHGLLV